MPSNRGVDGDGFAAPLEVQDELDLIDTEIGLGFQQSALGGNVVDPAVLPSLLPLDRTLQGTFRDEPCLRSLLHILTNMLSGDTVFVQP